MKRSIFGGLLLLVLLLGSLGAAALMENLHSPISELLEQAADLAAEDLPGAVALARQAKAAWKEAEPLSACFADHNPMEEMNQEFARLEIFAREEEPLAFAAACGSLAEKMQAMGDAHSLQWRNLF